jgi:hypothetical protein
MNIFDEFGGTINEAEGEAHRARDVDAAFVTYRLEEAGATLLALPATGYSTRLKVSHLEVVHEAREAYGWEAGRIRPAVPSAARITRMDEALGWIALIPRERYVLRRIVGARSLVSPVTERHLFSWRRLGAVVGADHKAVQRWHAQGIAILVGALAAAQRDSGGGGRQAA